MKHHMGILQRPSALGHGNLHIHAILPGIGRCYALHPAASLSLAASMSTVLRGWA